MTQRRWRRLGAAAAGRKSRRRERSRRSCAEASLGRLPCRRCERCSAGNRADSATYQIEIFMMKSLLKHALAAVALALAPSFALAEWPKDHPIKMIVGFAPG